jgi:hypothetical protein
VVRPGNELSGRNALPGDVILVSGTWAITAWRSWPSARVWASSLPSCPIRPPCTA